MADSQTDGLVKLPTTHTVDAAVAKLTQIFDAKGVKLFALVDHSGEAAQAGLEMLPTKLLIFGNPKAGTPVMQAAPTAAIDLPLKILIWQDAQGQVWIGYNSPEYLAHRHSIPANLVANLAAVEGLARQAAA
jgi:uncharacterized protein (DUF302 family)